MANRDLNFTPTVNNVTPSNPNELAVGLAEVAAKVADQSEQSKVLLSTTKAQVEFKKLDAEFRMNYASDPTNADGMKDLAEKRQNIVEGLSEGISSFYTRDFTDKTTALAGQSDASNEIWAVGQHRENTVMNFNTSIKAATDMANHDGQAYGASDNTDGSNVMNYLTVRQNLEQTAGGIVGPEKTAELLKSFNKDYVKSFVSGVAENNPVKAAALLENADIAEHFTTEERGDMVDQIAKVKKQQKLASDLTVTVSGSAVPDILNDPNTTYYEKRAAIDQLDQQGAITTSMAAKARRVIKSSSDLDSQTDTPVMARVINQIYDLNAASSTNASEYLRGVRAVQENILDLQASGQLTAPDAGKLNKQLTTLTNKRMSEATQSVGGEFYEANQKFNQLPPEYRGEATRALFYAADGKDFNKTQYSNMADTVLNDINAKRRGAAVKVAEMSSANDAVFLRSIKATSADVSETAKRYHISEQEVIRQLRRKNIEKLGDQPAAPVVLHGADDEGADDTAGESGEE